MNYKNNDYSESFIKISEDDKRKLNALDDNLRKDNRVDDSLEKFRNSLEKNIMPKY